MPECGPMGLFPVPWDFEVEATTPWLGLTGAP